MNQTFHELSPHKKVEYKFCHFFVLYIQEADTVTQQLPIHNHVLANKDDVQLVVPGIILVTTIYFILKKLRVSSESINTENDMCILLFSQILVFSILLLSF